MREFHIGKNDENQRLDRYVGDYDKFLEVPSPCFPRRSRRSTSA